MWMWITRDDAEMALLWTVGIAYNVFVFYFIISSIRWE